MKKHIILLTFLLIFIKANSQELSIDETINYINSKFVNNQYKVELKKGGEFNFTEFMPDYYFGNLDSQEIERRKQSNSFQMKKFYTQKISISDIMLKNVGFAGGRFLNQIYCTNYSDGCLTTITYDVTGKVIRNNIGGYFDFPSYDKDTNDKLYNALNYLISLALKDEKYKINDTDPFANKNFKKNFEIISESTNSNKISLINENGVYNIWVNIGGIKEKFILDTGASEISLSQKSEKELIQKGIIKKEDYLESGLFRIADGSIVTCRRVNLKQIKVGSFVVKNVIASIGVSEAPLLLGKSFLDKFNKWSIDNNTQTLTLEK